MYLSHLKIQNFRRFGEESAELQIEFRPGVTALVGRNDSGKSAVIDAIRYALLTRDREFVRVQPEDFHIDEHGNQANEIFIGCKLVDLNCAEKGAFIEYLSYDNGEVVLNVSWTARRLSENPGVRRWIDVSVRSGVDGTGPVFEASVRELLSATYLRPLRDAEREMSPGRGSRLSQILSNVQEIKQGEPFDHTNVPQGNEAVAELSLVGLADHMSHYVRRHPGVETIQDAINQEYLSSVSIHQDNLRSKIDVSEGGTESVRLRQILERLELDLLNAATDRALGRFGLGSNNLLFMACELLLLGKEPEGLPLLLIEEPEAHLHPQRQLRLMEFLLQASRRATPGTTDRVVQTILSTHSPNLSSKIPLANLVLLEGRHAFSLAEGKTKLEKGDYRFLERFLDVTKANLFFAHGVLIVEGDAEAILLPVLANLIGKDLTERGVSVVNVGGKGLRRFSRIFQRRDSGTETGVPVACVADIDVMPDCAPKILGLVDGNSDQKWTSSTRRWKACRDFGEDPAERRSALNELRNQLRESDSGLVRTFVADHWTLEYDLAFCGLAEEVYVAANLAKNDIPLNEDRKESEDVKSEAKQEFATLKSEAEGDKAVLCSHIYRLFHSGASSKAVAAQYLSQTLHDDYGSAPPDPATMRGRLPNYLVAAIDHVTPEPPETPAGL